MILMPILFFFCFGCSDKSSDSAETDIVVPTQEIESIEKLFEIPERPFDLALHPDQRIFISGDAGGKLYTWDSIELKEEPTIYNDIQGILFVDSEFYYTTTDNGVTGALIRGFGNNGETIITQSSDGTLLRWPTDLVSIPNGDILISDYNAGVVFSVSSIGARK